MSDFTVPASIIRAAQACQGKRDVRHCFNGAYFHADGRIEASNGHIAMRATPEEPGSLFSIDGAPVGRLVQIDGNIAKGASVVTFVDGRGNENGMPGGIATTDKGRAHLFTLQECSFLDLARVFPPTDPATIPAWECFNPAYLATIAKVFECERVTMVHSPVNSAAHLYGDVDGYRVDMLIMGIRSDITAPEYMSEEHAADVFATREAV